MVLGVDVGGTFTDAVLATPDGLVTAKAPTTPDDQSEGVLGAVRATLDRADAQAEDVDRFVHGMTVGTNALLEGKVARTALLATEGFTDVEELGRQARADLYRLCVGHPPPLVPVELRVAVPERTGPDGVLRELDDVGEALGRDEHRARAAAFEQRVGRDRHPVRERGDLAGLRAGPLQCRRHGRHHPLGLVVGRGRRLRRDEPPAGGEHRVGEGPADVDADEHD